MCSLYKLNKVPVSPGCRTTFDWERLFLGFPAANLSGVTQDIKARFLREQRCLFPLAGVASFD